MTKGQVTEGYGVEAYTRAGYWVYKPERARFGDNDVFNLFDILAFHPRAGLRMIQIKTNGARGIREWNRKVEPFRRHPGLYPEFAVRVDGEGWRLLRPTGNGHTTAYDGRGWTGKHNVKLIDTRFAGFLRNELRRDR